MHENWDDLLKYMKTAPENISDILRKNTTKLLHFKKQPYNFIDCIQHHNEVEKACLPRVFLLSELCEALMLLICNHKFIYGVFAFFSSHSLHS